MRVEFPGLVIRIIILFTSLLITCGMLLNTWCVVRFPCGQETILLLHHFYPGSVKRLQRRQQFSLLAWFSCSLLLVPKLQRTAGRTFPVPGLSRGLLLPTKLSSKKGAAVPVLGLFFGFKPVLLNGQHPPYYFCLKFAVEILNKRCIHIDMHPCSELGCVL